MGSPTTTEIRQRKGLAEAPVVEKLEQKPSPEAGYTGNPTAFMGYLGFAALLTAVIYEYGFLRHDRYYWAAVAGLCVPHAFYACVWLLPKRWAAWTLGGKHPTDPVTAVEYGFFACKVLQLGGVAAWYSYHAAWDGTLANYHQLVAQPFNPYLFFYGMCLVAIGQVLNIAVYKTLGVAGVYYGSRLGKDIPWVEGFPFNAVPHPQYVGCVITGWGLAVCLTTPELIAAGGIELAFANTLIYGLSSMYEQYIPPIG